MTPKGPTLASASSRRIDSTALAGRRSSPTSEQRSLAVAGIVLASTMPGHRQRTPARPGHLDDVLRATGHHLEVDKRVEVAAVAGGAA
ncbi:MAG: hypothetical protein IPN07_16810 [Dehalococcoidia bacterium]|nr:hypothetical protein [Dehalococcoidia bacterium]